MVFSFFFFQAEDGIRDLYVTGVQTCALPISWPRYPAIVRALDGDSTMTSLVPWPSPAAAFAFAPPPLFFEAAAAFAVVVLAGTLFPSLHPRRDRLAVPPVARRPEAETTDPDQCVP